MSTSCIVADYGEPADFHREKLVRARKGHTCGECGETIEPGDLYERVTGLWEGEWLRNKTCARCVNVRTDYFDAWVYGALVEDFYAEHGFDYRDGIPEDFAPCKEASP